MSEFATTGPRVVVCGSMSALADMQRLGDRLRTAGILVDVPHPSEADDPQGSECERLRAKRRASKRHLDLIRNKWTKAILVVNTDKYGQHDYIGPNAFAEIAVAFAHGRRIVLLQGIPHHFAEELRAWGVHTADGDHERAVKLLAEFAGEPPQDKELQLAL
jgi:hypothetical protein